MDLTVILVNWNTHEMLRDCLATVFAGQGALTMEVIVVDNGSTDESLAMLAAHFPQVGVIANVTNRGFAAANNQALSWARGRHVLLLNTDTLVRGDVLCAAVHWLDAHPKAAVLGPRVLNRDGTVQDSVKGWPGFGYLMRQTLGLGRNRAPNLGLVAEAEVPAVSGCAMFVRRAALAEVGVLDEAFFFYGEETDWCRRFAVAGWGVHFAPVGEIVHFGGGAARRLDHRRDVMLTEGTVRLHRKHGGLAAGLACYGLLLGFNASRAVLWAGLALARRPGARDRAQHFANVVADYPRAWPQEGRA
ncbi:glycosyltransferase family 2 protein [Aliigemmobacter aestuarii]|uniref:Glycosyltransferase family 2 protein n=1 Tax=Aliigemmobacter aestuarii TaxID=1445661 RepID=A0A4S3MKF5_9RHOB|nr:glycosyltransferase family 2 protein [Gemmobacter aestuarii]THD82305.1 glycosyltransferase family 2 protein [Gemmobacter aestuarii]